MLSVVIASIGNKSLQNTVDSINASTVKPNEILILLPSSEHLKSLNIEGNNVVLINADTYGQVNQRLIGFKKAVNKYVLQLDDDIILDEFCLEQLLDCLSRSNSNISVSPYYLGFNNRPIHKSSPHGLMMKLFHYCMNGRNGYQPGKIAKSGINYGINKISLKKEEGCVSVDWQPGGCILHKRSNLIKENYFPYRGKAYSEDLIHSYLLRKKGVKLLVNLDAYCFISSDIQFEKLGELFLDFKSRFYFVKMAGLSKPRLFVYYMIFSIKYFLRKINIT